MNVIRLNCDSCNKLGLICFTFSMKQFPETSFVIMLSAGSNHFNLSNPYWFATKLANFSPSTIKPNNPNHRTHPKIETSHIET